MTTNILIPRRIEERNVKHNQADLLRIQKYIENGCKGDLDLSYSKLTKLPDDLVIVNGKLNLNCSNIEDLNNLRYVKENLCLYDTPIKSLPNNLIINGILDLGLTSITELPEDIVIGSDLYIDRSSLVFKTFQINNFKGRIIEF